MHLQSLRPTAIDFESYYDDQLSIGIQGQEKYLEQTDVYMVAIASDDVNYCGPVEKAPWEKIDGRLWLAHNYSFDGCVVEVLRRKGIIRNSKAGAQFCTSNLAAYLQCPRSLADASHFLLNRSISKDPRKFMKGKQWRDVEEEKKKEIIQYAEADAKTCLELFNKYSAKMPSHEVELANHTTQMGWNGLAIDKEKVKQGIEKLEWAMIKAEREIPWAENDLPPLSLVELAKWCRDKGIEPPVTTNEDSPECIEWEEKYGEKYPIVAAMRTYRKANTILSKIKILETRMRPDGTFPYGLRYCGAFTGRFSGDSRFNMQNLPRAEILGVDLRSCIIPRPGKIFVIADFAQIEPRVLAYIAGNEKLLEAMREGYGIYEAFAAGALGWQGSPGTFKKTDPAGYMLAKASVLGLGYGAGWKKFKQIAAMQYGLKLNDEEASKTVDSFRTRNRQIVNLWQKLESGLKRSHKADFEVELPSGRTLVYRGVDDSLRNPYGRPAWGASQGYAKEKVTLWGGKLCENVIQATARDILAESILRLEKSGLRVVCHIHDEVIVECDPETDVQDIKQILCKAPEWMEGLPIDVEAEKAEFYKK